MNDERYKPGMDAAVISDIAKSVFGDFQSMFEYHDWPERGADMMRKVQTQVADTYGSVREFETYFNNVANARSDLEGIWNDDTSVLFTSFWGWTPETWGTVGWSNDQGRTRRENLLKELSDPFICLCYVTSNKTEIDPNLKGRLAGFYLISHERGDRNEFTHPLHHDRESAKWKHSLRAVRAFSFLPEYRPRAMDVFSDLSRTARTVSSMGKVITDLAQIDEIRQVPWIEVPVYAGARKPFSPSEGEAPRFGMVPAGPSNDHGYVVPSGTRKLPRELYILELEGDTSAYLGRTVEGESIVKIGLSASPDLRRQHFQKNMPRCAFQWRVLKSTRKDGHEAFSGFDPAVAGENAIKKYMATHAEWLGGEFYLASKNVVEAAWHIGRDAALNFEKESNVNDT